MRPRPPSSTVSKLRYSQPGPAASAKQTKNYIREQLINLAAYREMMRSERERERETEENKERVKRKSDGKKLWVQK